MASRPGRGTCPNCGSTQIEHHDVSGASVCTECGVILEENVIVSSVEFVEGAGGASSMVGQFVSATSSKAYSSSQGAGGRGGFGFSRDSRETTLANGRRRIIEVASRLRLGGHYVDSAHRLFTIAVEKNFVQGRRTVHVVASCLYIACRQEKSQHMLIDFSDALQVNVYTLGTCFLKFRRLLGLKLEIIDPALYVYRFAAHLDLDDKTNAVALTALRLVGRMKRDWIVAGRRPAGICAAALLIAARAHGFSREPQDVTRILKVCGMTVTSRIKEFELTPSASLTMDQFNAVEFQTEADPPAFTKNKIMEARARAIQEKNLSLLNSGVLDNPMDGKYKAVKWRDGKVRKKDKAFEQLYQTIEQDLLNVMDDKDETIEDDDENDDNNYDNNDEDNAIIELDLEDETESKPAAAAPVPAAIPTKQQPEEEDTSIKGELAVVDKIVAVKQSDTTEIETPRLASILKQESTKTTGLEISKTVTIAKDTLMEIPKEWVKAYPKSRIGKALILPDQAVPEERQPPTVANEGKLDTRKWKENMPAEMVEEIDSIFRDPTEVAEKEAIFNKINKDYIDIQAQKDRIREKTEDDVDHAERDLLEQAQGHERYRKRKNRGRDTDETTQEALMQNLANRKISRKINYDAMSAIFDDAGSFATHDTGGGGTVNDEIQSPDF